MRRYAVAGLTLTSEVDLPELPEAERGTSDDWKFEVVPQLPSSGRNLQGHLTRDAEGEPWRILRLDGERLFLAFPDDAEFVVLAGERRIVCAAPSRTPDGLLRHLLLDQVIPHALALEGSAVLHASAVSTPEGALAFIGPSGAGKSSLAAGFAAEGDRLLSDDFLPLWEGACGFVAIPTYPALRLWPDSQEFFEALGEDGEVAEGTHKRRLLMRDERAGAAVPLAAIVTLAAEDPSPGLPFMLTPVPQRDAFLAVFEQGFRLGHLARGCQLAEFDLYTCLASSTRVLELRYRWEYDLLPRIRAALSEAVEGTGTAA